LSCRRLDLDSTNRLAACGPSAGHAGMQVGIEKGSTGMGEGDGARHASMHGRPLAYQEYQSVLEPWRELVTVVEYKTTRAGKRPSSYLVEECWKGAGSPPSHLWKSAAVAVVWALGRGRWRRLGAALDGHVVNGELDA